METQLHTLLQRSDGKKIMVLGTTELFSRDEIARYLERYGITLTDRPDEETIASIESAHLGAYEEMASEEAHTRGLPRYTLAHFEALLSKSLDGDSIRMVLKLSRDTERLVRLLANPHITDDLFVALLRMYDWEGEELMESSRNRKVLQALLKRFLALGPTQYDKLHSPVTLLQLVEETRNADLLDALLALPPLSFRHRGGTLTLEEAIASNPALSKETIRRLYRTGDTPILTRLAANPATDAEILHRLHSAHERSIDQALSTHPAIDEALFDALLEGEEEIVRTLLAHQPIDAARYAKIRMYAFDDALLAEIGANPHLDAAVRRSLLESANPALRMNLAANPTLTSEELDSLYAADPEALAPAIAANPSAAHRTLRALQKVAEERSDVAVALASNPSAEEGVLRALYALQLFEVHEALAANPSTPMDLLDRLKLDPAFREALTRNRSFTDRIKRELGL